MKNHEIKLAELENNEIKFKRNLDEIKEKQQQEQIKRAQKTHYTILTCLQTKKQGCQIL